MNYTSGGKPMLVHDCWFYQTVDGGIAILDATTNRGVIWNCSNSNSFFAQSNTLFLNMPVHALTNVWSGPSTMGTADLTGASNLYIEDCDFHGQQIVTNFDDNSKVVWRYNNMDNAGLGSHGYDTSQYGARHWEIYNNNFYYNNGGDNDGSTSLNLINHLLLRGGTGVVTDNYIEDINSRHGATRLNFSLVFTAWDYGTGMIRRTEMRLPTVLIIPHCNIQPLASSDLAT